MDCTVRVAKTKALISFAVTAKLICVFVFAYAKAGFLTTRLNYSSCSSLNSAVDDIDFIGIKYTHRSKG